METAAPPPRLKAFSLTTKCGARGRRGGAPRRRGAALRPRGRAPGAARSLAVAPRDAVGERERYRARCREGAALARGRPARPSAVGALAGPLRSPPAPRARASPPPRAATIKAHATPPRADRDDDPNYNAYVIQAAAFFLIAALGLVWTVCACYECKKFTDCCCPNPECGPCACVECLPGFRPDASGDAKKTDGAGAVEMTEEV